MKSFKGYNKEPVEFKSSAVDKSTQFEHVLGIIGGRKEADLRRVIKEKSGAGEEGTDELVNTYKEATPGQKPLAALRKKKDIKEGSESWEAGYKRRVVKTTKPEHKEKGYKWRIKGKDRPEISIKLYKEKPDYAEFKKQMQRVAGHEFGSR